MNHDTVKHKSNRSYDRLDLIVKILSDKAWSSKKNVLYVGIIKHYGFQSGFCLVATTASGAECKFGSIDDPLEALNHVLDNVEHSTLCMLLSAQNPAFHVRLQKPTV